MLLVADLCFVFNVFSLTTCRLLPITLRGRSQANEQKYYKSTSDVETCREVGRLKWKFKYTLSPNRSNYISVLNKEKSESCSKFTKDNQQHRYSWRGSGPDEDDWCEAWSAGLTLPHRSSGLED